jgi:iron complex outermembrane receptor protein
LDGISGPTDYSVHLLLLIDGHRTNDSVYNAAYVGTDAILDIDMIERVEIIRGPGSSLYGANAFLGVINIITKRKRLQRPGSLRGSGKFTDLPRARHLWAAVCQRPGTARVGNQLCQQG